MQFTKRIDLFMTIPRWYGITYRDHLRDEAICHPVPFNVIIGLWLRFWWWLKRTRWGGKKYYTVSDVVELIQELTQTRAQLQQYRESESRTQADN